MNIKQIEATANEILSKAVQHGFTTFGRQSVMDELAKFADAVRATTAVSPAKVEQVVANVATTAIAVEAVAGAITAKDVPNTMVDAITLTKVVADDVAAVQADVKAAKKAK